MSKHPVLDSNSEDPVLETSLRPKSFKQYIGQEKVKQNLEILIKAAKERSETLDHILFYGAPGLGKTTLANIIAYEMNVNIKTTSGPAIERPGDLAAILTNLQENDILFIDEIHRLSRGVEEVLYPSMEDYKLDIIIGKGPSARSIRLDIPRFTLIGATTRAGMLSSPLRDRFGFVAKLNFYTHDELLEILMHSAATLNLNLDKKAGLELAKRSRGTPRITLRLLKRVRDWAQVKKLAHIGFDIVHETLAALGIDNLGLDETDRKLLSTIIITFNGGPVGLDTLSASIAEDPNTIEDVFEPFLLQLGLIERTPRGRTATIHAYKHLNIKPPANYKKVIQPMLFNNNIDSEIVQENI
ncbi:MAG: Holliday junction branch migration DNA helicase RuvB [Candidatus Margulisbacteria bacterium]|nr:Holliday junction branch migration DNA helicase RuvB [Candidatus Margulisiibacteriota bacterium]